MQTVPLPLHLSVASRLMLANHIGLNGTLHYPVQDVTGAVRATVNLAIEQSDDELIARVEMGESVNTLTLPKREDTVTRLAAFIDSLANGVGVEDLPVCGIETMLREAVHTRRGTYYLPVDGIESLALLVRQSPTFPDRVAFRFELDGVCMTLPVHLPSNSVLAYELLYAYVRDFVANYRTAA